MDGLAATALIIPLYLLIPLIAPAKPVPGEGLWQTLMSWERTLDAPVTAFPAFHAVWACLAARVWSSVPSRPAVKPLPWILAAAIAVSCITTGMHAVVDVVGGLAAVLLVWNRSDVWALVLRAAEKVANTWRERTIGSVRFMLHGLYAAAGAVIGVGIGVSLAGISNLGWLVAMAVAAVLGAALWAQSVEGSPQLLRPFGYFGAVLGVIAVALAAHAAGADAWLVFTALGTGGAFTQAVGRLRCLAQGCCHGDVVPDGADGIRYVDRHSRVVRLARLGGVPLHATPVYSMLWMLFVGFVLLRLWAIGAPLQIIAGAYFILAGLGRFVEEHYRGEPQTMVMGGLRVYQWLAIASVVGGAVATTLGADPAPAVSGLDPAAVPTLLGVGVLVYAAFGVDFPRSSRRFSRLA
jgi:hypothetical protein